MTMRMYWMLVAGLALGACGPGDRGGDDDGRADADPNQPDADPSQPDGGSPPGDGVIVAHSADALYRLNPETRELTLVGNFGWPDFADEMTDIAIDKDGLVIGVSFTDVYVVDIETARCTRLSTLSGASDSFNGLSFLPAGTLDPNVEALVGTTVDGEVFRINPQTGATTFIGTYGNGLGSSGDLFSVEGFGTIATVVDSGGTEQLASINPQTGAATVIGPTGVSGLWGVAFWEGHLYGFSDGGQMVELDPATGVATVLDTLPTSFWGAGVTTAAPIID